MCVGSKVKLMIWGCGYGGKKVICKEKNQKQISWHYNPFTELYYTSDHCVPPSHLPKEIIVFEYHCKI